MKAPNHPFARGTYPEARRPQARLGFLTLEDRNAAGSILDLLFAGLAPAGSDGLPVQTASPIDARGAETGAVPEQSSAIGHHDSWLAFFESENDEPTDVRANQVSLSIPEDVWRPKVDEDFVGFDLMSSSVRGATVSFATVESLESAVGASTETEFSAPTPLEGGLSNSSPTQFVSIVADAPAAGSFLSPGTKLGFDLPVSDSTRSGPGPKPGPAAYPPGYNWQDIVTGATVREVTFSGPDLITVEADPGESAYPSPPHWLDTDVNGVIDAPGDHALPVAYPRGKDAVVSARFKANFTSEPFVPPTYSLFVRASNTLDAVMPSKFFLPPTPVHLEGGDLVLDPTTVANPFPTYVNYGTLGINWEFTNNTETSWASAGRTENELYVTLAPRIDDGPVYHTVIYHAVESSAGSTTETQVVAANWTRFTTLNHKDRRGNTLFYYKNWFTPYITRADLLLHRDGQCGAWTEYLLSIAAVNGIRGSTVEIAPKVDAERMLIKNWQFAATNQSPIPAIPGYPLVNQINPGNPWSSCISQFGIGEDATFQYIFSGLVDSAVKLQGIPGQNNPNPIAHFRLHVTALIGGVYYDPSYGKSYTTLQAWENGAVDGFVKSVIYPGSNPNEPIPQYYWAIRANPAGLDVKERIFPYGPP